MGNRKEGSFSGNGRTQQDTSDCVWCVWCVCESVANLSAVEGQCLQGGLRVVKGDLLHTITLPGTANTPPETQSASQVHDLTTEWLVTPNCPILHTHLLNRTLYSGGPTPILHTSLTQFRHIPSQPVATLAHRSLLHSEKTQEWLGLRGRAGL